MTQSNVSEELLHLRKRARRRLVGAVALVVFALVVLWTVLDNAPPPQFASNHPIEITSSAPALAPMAAPVVAIVDPSVTQTLVASAPEVLSASTPASQAGMPETAGSAENVLPGKLINRQTDVNVEPKPAPKVTPTPPARPVQASQAKPTSDPRRILEGLDDPKPAAVNKYFLQVGAFADAGKAGQIVSRLKVAGLPAFSEKVSTAKGELTRVRVGPSTTEARADEWRKKAEATGVSGKVVRQ